MVGEHIKSTSTTEDDNGIGVEVVILMGIVSAKSFMFIILNNRVIVVSSSSSLMLN